AGSSQGAALLVEDADIEGLVVAGEMDNPHRASPEGRGSSVGPVSVPVREPWRHEECNPGPGEPQDQDLEGAMRSAAERQGVSLPVETHEPALRRTVHRSGSNDVGTGWVL